jgi:hypothetical protein
MGERDHSWQIKNKTPILRKMEGSELELDK